MYLLNGELQDCVALTDRSFQYGDGCFTTMLTRHGQVQHWHRHIARMDACLKLLGIESPDWRQIECWLKQMANTEEKAGLKLHISRGEGGRGYSPTQVTSSNVTISAFPFPSHYEQWCQDGVVLGVCHKRLGITPMLAGHKHNNRLEQILLKADIEQQGYVDGIALDCNDKVVETTMANLFWLKGEVLYTPSLSNAGVDGVMRRVVLDVVSKLGVSVKEADYVMEDLLAADEVFVTNSILGVAPVSAIEKQTFLIGKLTRTIQEKALS